MPADEALLRALRDALKLDSEPLRIECFAISNIQGSDIVASMVCFENGVPNKAAYRKFKVRSVSGAPDDFASMREVVGRRVPAVARGEGKELPDQVLIYGGEGQLGAALAALEELGLPDQPLASLAKQEELTLLPRRPEPVRLPLPHSSPARYTSWRWRPGSSMAPRVNRVAQRVEFSARVKRAAAGRSGYRCSFPDCGRGTIGPGPGYETTSTGVCAHIFSAAPGGPRGQGGLAAEDLSAIHNAIWVCSLHGDLIDKNNGYRYPPEVLLSFKNLHEARVAHDQGGLGPHFFWIQEVRIHASPIFAPNTRLRLGKVTLLSGDNESGKSALCTWLAGFADPPLLEAWEVRPGTAGPDLSVVSLTVSGRQEQRTTVKTTGRVEYFVDGTPVPFLSAPIQTLRFVPEPLRPVRVGWPETYPKNESPRDDVKLIAARLGLSPGVVHSLIACANHSADDVVRNLQIHEEDGGRRLTVDVQGTRRGLAFGSLSHSEQVLVLVRLAAAYGNTVASTGAALLLLDGGLASLDSNRLRRTVGFLLETDQRFQSLIVLPRGLDWPRPWGGWEFARLVGTATGVRLEQGAE